MTKLHVHYSIVIYPRNLINCLLLIPTVYGLSVMRIGQQSADFVFDFCCFLGSADCFWDLVSGLVSTDRLSTIDRLSVKGRLTLFKMSHSNPSNCQLIIRATDGGLTSGDSRPSDGR